MGLWEFCLISMLMRRDTVCDIYDKMRQYLGLASQQSGAENENGIRAGSTGFMSFSSTVGLKRSIIKS